MKMRPRIKIPFSSDFRDTNDSDQNNWINIKKDLIFQMKNLFHQGFFNLNELKQYIEYEGQMEKNNKKKKKS